MPVSHSVNQARQQFARDIRAGLQKTPRQLPSKYFYDARGDELFQQIMHMPEYYLTNCEFEILENEKQTLLDLIGPEHFDLIELGAGDGHKTKILLEHFLEKHPDFTYMPVDISANVLDLLGRDLHRRWPQLEVSPMRGDYIAMLEKLHHRHHARKVILFMGGNIGNLPPQRARSFLERIREHMDPGDFLIIGFDLKKDPEIILRAYNDPAGITAAFNLNLLQRINRELDGDFDLVQFRHWETYDPVSGAARSFLVSTVEQTVRIGALDQYFSFAAWEAMEVELSQKYSLPEIEALAEDVGFTISGHLTDRRDYFVDTVWRK